MEGTSYFTHPLPRLSKFCVFSRWSQAQDESVPMEILKIGLVDCEILREGLNPTLGLGDDPR